MIRLLFICPGERGGSAMAAAFADAMPLPPGLDESEQVRAQSAAITRTELHPMAIDVMREVGLDISGERPLALAEIGKEEFDVIVALCRRARDSCRVLPGNPEWVEWNIEPPTGEQENIEEPRRAFQTFRDEIRRLVGDLFDCGYLTALVHAKRQADLILGNLSEGIIAHDFERRIFYYNQAAERITEYSRREVIGRDCHDVFPGGLCGGKCAFSGEARTPRSDSFRQTLDIATKSGERRRVEMLVKTMRDGQGQPVGVLASFQDQTREWELARRVGDIEQFSGIIGRHPRMLEVFDLIRDVASSNVSVLIQGESGTGKELVAAAIHREGPRANRLFVPVNCGALPEGLLESELFGHVRGAFTGAVRDKKGRFELADGGTIFLDEIGDVSPSMQVKLLRVLQEGCFERVGSEKTIQVDVRVISATNKDLPREIREGQFREDLFYRLSVMPVQLPPLRDRRTDIPLLADHILKHFLQEMNRGTVTLGPEALDIMLSYAWPGNVRELQNWIQFALVKCKGDAIRPEHLPFQPSSTVPVVSAKGRRRRKLSPETVERALAETKGNKLAAARLLGVSRATLYRFLDEANSRRA